MALKQTYSAYIVMGLVGVMMDKKKIILAAIIIALAFTLYFLGPKLFSSPTSMVSASGTIEARQVDITATIPGTMRELYITGGQLVEKDQVVARVERKDLEAQRERDAMGVMKAEAKIQEQASVQEQARAGLRSASSVLAQAQAGVALSRSLLDQAEAGKRINDINLAAARLHYERSKILYENGALSSWQLEEVRRQVEILQAGSSEAAVKQAEAGMDQALSVLEQAYAGTEKARAVMEQSYSRVLEAEWEQTLAVLQATDMVLNDLVLVSPIKGVVLFLNYETGEYLPAGSKVATIADLDEVYIRVYIPTEDLPIVRMGQAVTFTVSGLDKEFTGIVEEIAQRGEFTPKMIQTDNERANIVFAVKITAGNLQGFLKPGMPADVVFGPRSQ